ncbi:MAG TPA: hypothetical protein VFB63_01165 [Bryobacteraceae bacterium]|jgi:hypothetical protein|nr:hypothetical protein [Bryobacteraceae bacterium]
MTLRSAIQSALALAVPLLAVEPSIGPGPLITHEWGTFTTVAREDGSSVRWAPLSGPADLPCFVANLGSTTFKQRSSGLVRMETPVLYFYSAEPVTLSVRVGFPHGWITEWYPFATSVIPSSPGTAPVSPYAGGTIRWDSVEVLPGHAPTLPKSARASHYYAARETDSAPLRIGTQWEKLIFYRGVGDFQVPLRPVFTHEKSVRIENLGPETIPLAILFENRDGKIGYLSARSLGVSTEIKLPDLTTDLSTLRRELSNELVEFGLYRKEALAMIETWRDSWFEEGMRLFYIVPRTTVDALLPLDIKPAPSSIARVFVGRIEMLSPATREIIEAASATGDSQRLTKMGRFLGPWITQMERENPGRPRSSVVQSIFRQPLSGPGCVQ